jgi:vacuolar iron transporter family protein
LKSGLFVGLSMGVGNYLAIRSHESAREAIDLPEEEASPARHGAMTFLAFVVAGAIPMLPYFFGPANFPVCVFLTLVGLFARGSMRALVTTHRWWTAGLEMLGLGILVAGVAYGSGAAAARLFG